MSEAHLAERVSRIISAFVLAPTEKLHIFMWARYKKKVLLVCNNACSNYTQRLFEHWRNYWYEPTDLHLCIE